MSCGRPSFASLISVASRSYAVFLGRHPPRVKLATPEDDDSPAIMAAWLSPTKKSDADTAWNSVSG